MIDFDQVEGFEWDDGNSRKSADKHGVSGSEAEQVFFNTPLLMFGDSRHSAEEVRFLALGKTNVGRLLLVSFTMRQDGKLIRVISARAMSRNERAEYEKA